MSAWVDAAAALNHFFAIEGKNRPKSGERKIVPRTTQERAERTVFQKSQESRRKYWATRSSIPSFARTAHSFARYALLASLAHSAALICTLAPLTHSLTPELVGN